MCDRKSFLSPRIRDPRGDIASPGVNAGAKNPAGKSFMLTLERLREVLSYDPETGVWRWVVTRANRRPAGSIAGSISKTIGYREIRVDGALYRSARLACLYMNGEWPVGEVDHRDLDRTNDRWENLRLATRLQNAGNQRVRAHSLSGIKGVRIRIGRKGKRFETGKRFQARIASKHLGYFTTEVEACAAYLKAAKEMFGEFARSA
jgi:hypothetical protein